jgi:hypothetical protein
LFVGNPRYYYLVLFSNDINLVYAVISSKIASAIEKFNLGLVFNEGIMFNLKFGYEIVNADRLNCFC